MYKVFINNKCIFFVQDGAAYSGNYGKTYKYSSRSGLLSAIDDFEKDRDFDNLFVLGDAPDLASILPLVEAAGGLVKKPNNQILFIYRYGKWDLPKGKMDPGETPQETAIREVMEETGVTGLEIIKELSSTYHTYRMEGKRVLKRTHWFEMSFKDDSNILPQENENITVVKWLNEKDIPWMMRDSYASVIDLLTDSGYL